MRWKYQWFDWIPFLLAKFFKNVFEKVTFKLCKEKKLFFFLRNVWIQNQIASWKVFQKALGKIPSQGSKSASLWWFHWCWWQNLYFGDIRSTTSLKDWVTGLVKSVTNIFNGRHHHRCRQSYRWIMIDPFLSWWSYWTNNCMYGWQFWSARMVPF